MTRITTKGLSLCAVALTLGACANMDQGTSAGMTPEEIEKREAQVTQRERTMEQQEEMFASRTVQQEQELERLRRQRSETLAQPAQEPLLPPSAKVGECYARVWVPPTYESDQLRVKTRDASETIQLIDAEYAWVEEEVMVTEASSRLESVPAVYREESETILVSAERNTWTTSLVGNAAPASDRLLAGAQSAGIDLDAAQPGMCYHEHFTPARYRTVSDSVMTREASTSIETLPAQYEWGEERVLVAEASQRIEETPAVFETVTETIVDVPAHTIWKKGTGPIQRIDEATGEIMCLVEVPATHKTIAKRVLKSPATTRTIEIPAKYETVKVRREIADPSQVIKDLPAEYATTERQELVADTEFVWHEVSDKTMSKESRTGSQICLVNTPARYETVTRTVVVTPAATRRVGIPAEYQTVKVKKLASPAREQRTTIPATYETVTQQRVASEGRMEWRSILCDTNMTTGRISEVQDALKDRGFDPGPVDGVLGNRTIVAINEFQAKNALPVDKYLNLETLDALGVAAN